MVLKTATRYRLAALMAALILPFQPVWAQDAEPGVLSLQPALAPAEAQLESFLDPNAELWQGATASPVHLNRTPPLYGDGPFDDGARPEADVRLIRLSDDTVVARFHWTDAQQDAAAQPAQYPDAGSRHVYKRHTTETDAFSDAFCVMVPKTRGPQESYPSLMMGEKNVPVELYYWRSDRGFERMDAHGRSTVAGAESKLQGQAQRVADGWAVTVALPKVTPGTPVCFAVWDGARDMRDGLKFYSLWYEVK